MPDLGQIKRTDLRTVWRHEAINFTPWLAEPENIELLGQVIGMDLEVIDTEVAAGPYSADILAQDTATGDYVVIENQLGKTDHDHLGKALLYASALDAKTVVWIAGNFTQEHAQVFDWLNDGTKDNLSFYAVQLELWQIDGSRPAPRFMVLSKPSLLPLPPATITELEKLHLKFWQAVANKLAEERVVSFPRKPLPRNNYKISLGISGINLTLTANTLTNKIGIKVYLKRAVAHSALRHFLDHKEEIESTIGAPLSWDPNPDRNDKVIALSHDANLGAEELWPEYISWLVDKTDLFQKAFKPLVRTFSLS